MAYIYFPQSDTAISNFNEVDDFFQGAGIIYEQWDITRIPQELRDNYLLTDEQKQVIIEAYTEEIDNLHRQYGYRSQDLVVLSEHTPNIELLLTTFKREHHHVDDEVRFTVDGSGVFTVVGDDQTLIQIVVTPGDLLIVPAKVRHYFELEKTAGKIKCIRIFKSPAGWDAIFERPPS